MSDNDLKELQRRNALRVALAIAILGDRYVFHPARVLRRPSIRMAFTRVYSLSAGAWL